VSIWEILVISVGLSMDAFAVSITLGLEEKNPTIILILIPGFYFGFFQALMPLTGFFAGTYFAKNIQFLDHWVAFILLSAIGANMIKESFSRKEEKPDAHPLQFIKMLLLAIATSIDALAIGITFSFFKINIFTSILIIGLTTFCISTAGVRVGNIFGTRFKSKAEFAGGTILILLGVKILIEHLFFANR
jgi:manganese efflux pump family protein